MKSFEQLGIVTALDLGRERKRLMKGMKDFPSIELFVNYLKTYIGGDAARIISHGGKGFDIIFFGTLRLIMGTTAYHVDEIITGNNIQQSNTH